MNMKVIMRFTGALITTVFVDQPVSKKQRQKWTVILLYK
jgi:hypothetical protein